jgi:uncharacterized repeat protein (TIGR03803 family)
MSYWKAVCLGCALFAGMAVESSAQFKTLVNFDAINSAYPGYMSLVQGTDGNLYGTTEGYGSSYYGRGTVFKMTASGTLTTIYTFCLGSNTCTDGAAPYAGLLLATDGVFYGTTFAGGPSSSVCIAYPGGCGTIFKVTRTGALTTLHSFSFSDGANPVGALIQGIDGNLYGTTAYGGSGTCVNLYNPGCGTIFKINPKSGFTVLHSFSGTDGWSPYGGLIQGTDGSFYGTTTQGGTNNGGTIFRITSAGEFATLYDFCSQANCADGEGPEDALLQASDGNFYGTTASGGAICGFFSSGTIFKFTPNGKLTTLTDFCPSAAPLIQGSDGNLYGTTSTGGYSNNSSCYAVFNAGCGTAFKIVAGGPLTILHNFDGLDGYGIIAGMVQGTNGSFYGATPADQTSNIYGSIFRLTGGLGPFIAFVQPAGKVGKTAQILGQGLTGTTSVTFNGVAATKLSVVSDTYMTAVVPAGATTGAVMVATPAGNLTSNVSFRISK